MKICRWNKASLAPLLFVCALQVGAVKYDPMPTIPHEYPLDNAELQAYTSKGAASSAQVEAMRRHGWALFSSLVAPSGTNQQAVRWQTCYTVDDVMKRQANCLAASAPASSAAHSFEADYQSSPTPRPRKTAEEIRYNLETCRFIEGDNRGRVSLAGPEAILSVLRSGKYNDLAELENESANRMITVKAKWVGLDDGDEISTWNGRVPTAGLSRTSEISEMKQGLPTVCVAEQQETCMGKSWVSPNRFYHFTPHCKGCPTYVLLAGLHIATREQANWVWATYWWHDQPDMAPFGDGRPAFLQPDRSVWGNYLMDVAYDMDFPTEKDGKPHIAFNPWLEGTDVDGLVSNCMSCHRRASTLGTAENVVTVNALGHMMPNSSPLATVVRGSDATFNTFFDVPFDDPKRLKLGFIWSLVRGTDVDPPLASQPTIKKNEKP